MNTMTLRALARVCSKCREFDDRAGQRYCSWCHREYQRRWRRGEESISRGTSSVGVGAETGFLYLVTEEGGDLAKVGVAGDVAARVAYLQTGNGRALSAFKTWAMLRSAAHRLERLTLEFFNDRSARGEWLRVTPAEVECFIESCLAKPSLRLGLIELSCEAG